MILNQEIHISKDLLYNIMQDLNNHKNRNKIDILEKAIRFRLDKSMKSYYDSLTKTLTSLTSKLDDRNDLKYLKQLNKE